MYYIFNFLYILTIVVVISLSCMPTYQHVFFFLSLSCISGFRESLCLFVWLSEKTDGLMAPLLNVNDGERMWEEIVYAFERYGLILETHWKRFLSDFSRILHGYFNSLTCPKKPFVCLSGFFPRN